MKEMKKIPGLLYEKIVADFERQIMNEVLVAGDRLPSVRAVCRIYQVSMSTTLEAYHRLESKNLIKAKPQSGYFVRYMPGTWPAMPAASRPSPATTAEPADQLVRRVYEGLNGKNMTALSMGVPATELLPVAKLNKQLLRATRALPGGGTGYSSAQGNEKLRRFIATGALKWEGNLHPDSLITTNGCSHAIALSLMATTKTGDTIVVESPTFFGILQLARSLGLKVLEIPTHPVYGVAPETLKNILEKKKPAAVVLMTNFSNPLGSTMPDENKKEFVRLFQKHGRPLIEDDIYGDLYFSGNRPGTCKTYDEEGWVLYCSSFSKTLAPGYRTGWVAPGRFFQQVYNIRLFQNLSAHTVLEESVANFLENGSYERHLDRFRAALHANAIRYLRAVSDYFPPGTKTTRPRGGFFLWLQLQNGSDTSEIFEMALKHKISFAPGRIFSLQRQFTNCMRLSYGFPWTGELDRALKILGRICKKND
jgi:DNA-binding transcriptional MocR family regulator